MGTRFLLCKDKMLRPNKKWTDGNKTKVSDIQVNQDQWEKSINDSALNSAYNEVTFNEKLAITKENLCTKYFPFTDNNVILNEKPPIMKENLHILFCYRQS